MVLVGVRAPCCLRGAERDREPFHNLIVATHTSQLMVYKETTLLWAARAHVLPIALSVATFGCVRCWWGGHFQAAEDVRGVAVEGGVCGKLMVMTPLVCALVSLCLLSAAMLLSLTLDSRLTVCVGVSPRGPS